jgi:membrane fusion protein (multidrug efflux system)
MTKRILITLVGLLLLVGGIAGIKTLQIRKMMDKGAGQLPPPETVTTAKVQIASWEMALTAVGSLTAVQGVTVAAEQPGKVVRIAFVAGATVAAGDLLVQLDTVAEEAQLRALETSAALAKVNLGRMTELVGKGLVARAEFDSTEASFKQAVAQADNLRAVIAKKQIRAPFSGRLGIRLVNLGQILKEGTPVVSLQVLQPILVNFSLPQQDLARLRPGLSVRLTAAGLGQEPVTGEITAINPELDGATRSVTLQATVANSDERLRPGMFATVTVVLPDRQEVLALPATAVLYAPYSDSVFVVEEKKDEATGVVSQVLRQQFVRIGEKRGDFVAVREGLKPGESVVSTGVFKLRNGQAVVVDNTLAPDFELAPQPENN